MKRYLKYGVVLVSIMMLGAAVFYFIYRQKDSLVKQVPADVLFCFTMDKRQLYKDGFSKEELYKDSFFQNLKHKIPAKSLEIFNQLGMNLMGDMVFFGTGSGDINLAWFASNKDNLVRLTKRYKAIETTYSTHTQLKFGEKIYLNYKWPVVVLSSKQSGKDFDFFNPKVKKLLEKDLKDPALTKCSLYGFYTANRNIILTYSFLPIDGRAFIGLSKTKKGMELKLVQRKVKLEGKLGLPKTKPKVAGLVSWPITPLSELSMEPIPTVVTGRIDSLLRKPVKHFYGEVLDTISTYQEIVKYLLDAEFRLTQKIIYHFKSYPGLRLQFLKKTKDESDKSFATNLGLDILKLQFSETGESYIISSENTLPLPSYGGWPDYYVYSNIEMLRADPFWEPYIKTNFSQLELYAQNLDKGSMFTLALTK